MQTFFDFFVTFLFIITLSFFLLLIVFTIIDKYHKEKLKTQIEIDKQMLYNQKEFQIFVMQMKNSANNNNHESIQ